MSGRRLAPFSGTAPDAKGLAGFWGDLAAIMLGFSRDSKREGLMNKKGFTLIELLIVVAIIGIIVAVAIPNLLIALQKGHQKVTMADMTSLGTAIESYIVDWGLSPAQGATDVTALERSWFIPFYIKVLPLRDGWGSLFQYEADFSGYSVTSLGRNKINDGMAFGEYPVTALVDFNNDIIFSDGRFTVAPMVKK